MLDRHLACRQWPDCLICIALLSTSKGSTEQTLVHAEFFFQKKIEGAQIERSSFGDTSKFQLDQVCNCCSTDGEALPWGWQFSFEI